MIHKLVIVINGPGGVGKDTICDIVGRHYRTKNVSSITPIKEIAASGGWNPADKSLPARKLLSDLKQAFTEYNDLPTAYLLDEYEKFLKGDAEIIFMHIREGSEISKLLSKIPGDAITLLILRSRDAKYNYGNPSDDLVEAFDYDYTYFNEKPLEELEDDFMAFFREIISSLP